MTDFDIGLGPDFKVKFGPEDHQAFDTDILTIVRNGQSVPVRDLNSLKKP